jgi:hypothetical protein
MKRRPRKDTGGRHYIAPSEKHRVVAKLILMGYTKYAAMRAVGYSHSKARKALNARCLRIAIREAFLEQQSAVLR